MNNSQGVMEDMPLTNTLCVTLSSRRSPFYQTHRGTLILNNYGKVTVSTVKWLYDKSSNVNINQKNRKIKKTLFITNLMLEN